MYNVYTVCRYSRYYEPLLAPLAQAPVRLLEIGVEDGRSLAAWRRYFPQVSSHSGNTDHTDSPDQAEHIWGLGLDAEARAGASGRVEWGAGGVAPCGGDPAPPCSIVRGDQSDEAFLQSFIHQVSCDWWRAMLSPDWWRAVLTR